MENKNIFISIGCFIIGTLFGAYIYNKMKEEPDNIVDSKYVTIPVDRN